MKGTLKKQYVYLTSKVLANVHKLSEKLPGLARAIFVNHYFYFTHEKKL